MRKKKITRPVAFLISIGLVITPWAVCIAAPSSQRIISREERIFAGTNDPYLSQQWNLGDSASNGINIRPLRKAGITGKGVVVAVIDSGLDTSLPDAPAHVLPGRLYRDVDDYVDGHTEDDCGHGTSMASIIAARTNNGYGIAGIAPEATILPIKIFWKGEDGKGIQGGNGKILAACIDYAVAQGADVISMSLSVYDGGKELEAAVDRATENGCIIVGAAGNHEYVYTPLPARLPGVISAGATDRCGKVCAYTTTDKVDIYAPGGTAEAKISSASQDKKKPVKEGYGTSYSAVAVSGIAALFKELDPDMSQAEFLELAQNNATIIQDVEDTGLLNAGRMFNVLQQNKENMQ